MKCFGPFGHTWTRWESLGYKEKDKKGKEYFIGILSNEIGQRYILQERVCKECNYKQLRSSYA